MPHCQFSRLVPVYLFIFFSSYERNVLPVKHGFEKPFMLVAGMYSQRCQGSQVNLQVLNKWTGLAF